MTADRVLAAVLLLGAAVYLGVLVPEVGRAQSALGSGDFYTVGPTALPTFAGTMMAIFAVAVLLMGRRTAPEVPFTQGLGGGLIFAAAVAAAAVLLPRIGFLPASVLFLAVVFALFRAKWWVALILTIVLPVVIDQILRKVFPVPLPGAALF
ncbi:tripartite tricarboxylate transporter TctB family protein [Acuticoccus sp. M5D2P5]|uniref:tripartite tricarboxylate transporter TctB family protein n=1 Tax=Acuticoccus kalidii TaxID=2910977 RepID=UPI001F175CB4|nr:tripartite tricarboxylate transporter TctB family protein [Acuticoccus kalidii]